MILCKKSIGFIFLLFFLHISNIFGQDAHYSQFYANPVFLNPAFTGTLNCPRFCINFRDQYPTIPNNFISFSGSYDQHIRALHGGVGLLFAADIQGSGIFSAYNAGLIYTYRIQAGENFFLQFALQGSYGIISLKWEKLVFASNILNSSLPHDAPSNINFTKSQFDAGIGAVGYTRNLYFGLAVHHFLPIHKNFYPITNANDKWSIKWTGHFGGKINIIKKRNDEDSYGDVSVYPNIVFLSQKDFHYLHEGFYFSLYPLTIGTWLRHNFKSLDAFIISCGVEYKIVRMGYSYDFSLTKLENSGGAHEISIQFVIPCINETLSSKSKRKYPSVACPRF